MGITKQFINLTDSIEVFRRIVDEFIKLDQAVDISRVTDNYEISPIENPKPFNRNLDFPQIISEISHIPKIELIKWWRNAPENECPLANCISTHNNLKYLKLAVQSARENSFFLNSPLFIHAENCTDGTNEWLEENADRYRFRFIAENNFVPRGIGGGMNYCANITHKDYVNFIHADFYCGHDWDWELLMARMKYHGKPVMCFSYRVQPDIFDEILSRPGTIIVDPHEFGELHSNFDAQYFLEWADNFREMNDFEIGKAEGVSGLISKKDWDFIGGNDPMFAPASYEDMDLFIRMLFEGYQFVMTSRSIVYHFGARSSHFPDDDFKHSSARQLASEEKNKKNWARKWKHEPSEDHFHMWRTLGLEKQYEYLKKHDKLRNFDGI